MLDKDLRRSWTDEMNATLLAEYGVTPNAELAAKLGKSQKSMRNHIARLRRISGISFPPIPPLVPKPEPEPVPVTPAPVPVAGDPVHLLAKEFARWQVTVAEMQQHIDRLTDELRSLKEEGK